MAAAIETGVPALVTARDLMERFHRMPGGRRRRSDTVAGGHQEQSARLVRQRHRSRPERGRAALTEPWSNGQTEGQITKLKLVKRRPCST